MDPAQKARLAAQRARVNAETEAARVQLRDVAYVCVERGGAATAAAAISKVVESLESNLSP